MSISNTKRKPQPTDEKIRTVCFRVTRGCNLSCPYCQAPPNGHQQRTDQLIDALLWLRERGCESVKFTGGEPLLYKNICHLINKCNDLGMTSTVVTNGTVWDKKRLKCIRNNKTRVKVSLHGFKERHNKTQNEDTYEKTISGVRNFLDTETRVSIHTLLHSDIPIDVKKWTIFLKKLGIYKVSYMPFIPRGRGEETEEKMKMSEKTIENYKNRVKSISESMKDDIVVRWIDFIDKPYIVYETDGSVQIQRNTESKDEKIVESVEPPKHRE